MGNQVGRSGRQNQVASQRQIHVRSEQPVVVVGPSAKCIPASAAVEQPAVEETILIGRFHDDRGTDRVAVDVPDKRVGGIPV